MTDARPVALLPRDGRVALLRYAVLACLGLAVGAATAQAQSSSTNDPQQYAANLAWNTFHNKGWNALRVGQVELAENLFRAELAEAQKFPPSDPRLATTYTDLGWIFLLKGQPEEAEKLASWSYRTRLALLGPKHPEVGDSSVLLTRINIALKRLDEAEKFANQAVAVYFKGNTSVWDRHPPFALDLLGEVREARGQLVEAEALYVRALNLRESALGSELNQFDITDKDLLPSFKRLSSVLRKMGRDADAQLMEDNARQLAESLDEAGAGDPGMGAEPGAAEPPGAPAPAAPGEVDPFAP